jgi:hypothetical protein
MSIFPFADKHYRDAFEKKWAKHAKRCTEEPVILSVGNGGARNKAPYEERQAKGATLRLSGPRRQKKAIDRIIYGVLRNGRAKERIAESYPEKTTDVF